MAQLFTTPYQTTLDANGKPISGAQLFFYDTGTLNHRDVYTTAALSTAHPSPIVADAAGRYPAVYLDTTYIYRVIVCDSFGTAIRDIDPYSINSSNNLSGSTGAGLVGTLASGTVQAFITSAQPVVTFVKTDGVTVGIGTGQLASRLAVQTSTAFTANGEDIYHYSQQTNPTNQTSALAIHNYTDGVSVIFDTVGAGYTLRLKQANNAAARVDQAATYVGTGGFLEFQRNRPSGGGVFPGGNIGGNNDRLTFVNPTGNLCFYGTDAQDWDGTNTKAPIQIGTYANFLNRMLYLGYRNDLNKSVIGSIDTGASAFTYLDIAALGMRPIGDNAVTLGADTLNWSAVYAYTVKTQAYTVATLPNSVTAGVGTRAFVSDGSVVAAGNFGTIIAGGGTNKVPVYSDSANWRIG